MEASHREEGPAPLLWRSSDFKDWAHLCPVEPEVGHALMRLVISGREIPHSCEVLENTSPLNLEAFLKIKKQFYHYEQMQSKHSVILKSHS